MLLLHCISFAKYGKLQTWDKNCLFISVAANYYDKIISTTWYHTENEKHEMTNFTVNITCVKTNSHFYLML